MRILRHPYETLVLLEERYGPVVKVGLGPVAFVYLLGRDANEAILNTNVQDFTWREAFASLIPLEGDTALPVTDGDEHDRRRRLVQPAFAVRRIRSYGAVMVEEIDRTIQQWQPGDRFDLHVELKRTVRRIAIRSLFGDHLGQRSEDLAEHLQAAIAFANLPPLPGRDLDLPFSPYRRAMRARARADKIIYAEISRRRTTAGDEGDLLSALMAAEDDNGSMLNDQELRDQVVSLIAAGYETTAALVAWALYAVLRDPPIQQRLQEELSATVGNGAIDQEQAAGCRYLHAVVQETLRLHSPAGITGRRAETDVDFGGHTIPTGAFVIYSPYVTHRQAEHWPVPLSFQPTRWLGSGDDIIEPAPYSFVPFGGGYRRCIGFAMATLEAKVIVAEVIRRTRLQLERHDIAAHGLATVDPKGGVPVRVLAAGRGTLSSS